MNINHHPLPINASTEYKPYNAPPSPPTTRRRRADGLVSRVTAEDVHKAYNLSEAIKPSRDELRARLTKEREELHAKSQQKVKDWTNTVLGERKKRLQALQQKQEEEERAREKIDEEWRVIRDRERKEAIEKARLMQYVQNAHVQQFHSKLLLADVLMERDLQIAHKKKLKEEARKQNEIEARQQQQIFEDDEAEFLKEHKAREARLEVARWQKQEAGKKNLERMMERQYEKEYYENIHRTVAAEKTKEKEEAKENKKKQIAATQEALGTIIKMKQDLQKQQEEEELKLSQDNERFNNIKSYLASKKKEVTEERAKHKEKDIDIVGEYSLRLQKEREAKMDQFLADMARSHEDEVIRKEEKQKAKKAAINQDLARWRMDREEERKRNTAEEKEKRKLERARLEEEARKDVEANKLKKEKAKEQLKDLTSFHMKQIREQRKREAEIAAENKRLEKAVLENVQAEKDRFDNYVKSTVEEFKMEGKHVRQILRHLHPSNPFPPAPVPPGSDTFERLGFTVRWVPTHPGETDPWQKPRGNRKDSYAQGQ
ncbi:hypothetical protein HDV05_008569 [Chytridiales sp. JEL 0842]|nr:hypothetical protein HDV05_008569 [Chytridiales sp. JEL 0842]